jgi:hypothetical protein
MCAQESQASVFHELRSTAKKESGSAVCEVEESKSELSLIIWWLKMNWKHHNPKQLIRIWHICMNFI